MKLNTINKLINKLKNIDNFIDNCAIQGSFSLFLQNAINRIPKDLDILTIN
ncbi:Uncharacterised protein [Mycoplasmopsis gallinacea]|uniref:Nucleotidyltransferase n=1 Tax=Mycoplasmopsis gallinacea TaxID=29556 RepID=A0A449A2U7_9BACT|nr:Uncharacterised protein [Mycoplasmopsis gallinacea]